MKIAFIGLGIMGRLMSANLAKAGYEVRSYDLNGSGSCKSAKEAAQGADFLITMLPDGKAVRDAVLSALPGLAAGSIVIDMSSSDPSDTKKLYAKLKAKSIFLVDAPVSGAKGKAADGTLAIMVGGDPAIVERTRPVLSRLGTEIFATGGLGSGHATKALNNYLGAAGTIAGFEALLVGAKFGLDPKVLVDVINASTGKNSTTERKIPQQIFTGAFASGFQFALMTKDVGIARDMAHALKVRTPYLENTLAIWQRAQRELPAGADHTEMYKYLAALRQPRKRPARKARATGQRRPRR